jgi:hypothetical protein
VPPQCGERGARSWPGWGEKAGRRPGLPGNRLSPRDEGGGK